MGKVNTGGPGARQQMVVTPGGLRPLKNVHLIEPGYHVSGRNGLLKKVHTASGRVVQELGPVNTEGGSKRNSLREQRRSISPQPISNQWIVYSGWTNQSGNPISYFATEWQVPLPPPSQDSQIIYLFNGMEDAAYNVILQPVLQWGTSPIGGGNYWAIANWYVGAPNSGLALHGPLIQVNTGDLLKGVMALTSQSNGEFSYLSSFVGYAADLMVQDIGELLWAVQTLECYYLNQFSDYPSGPMTAMKGIEIKTGEQEAVIQWAAYNAVTDNGQHCNIVSDASPGGEVDLYYS
jgi:hypothetical protein